MNRFARWIGVFLLLTLGLPPIFVSAQPRVGDTVWAEQASIPALIAQGQPTDDRPDLLSDFESEVIRLVNLARKENDASCPALTSHPILRQVAYAHSKDMADRNFFDHVNPDDEAPSDRVNKTTYEWVRLAENIAAGYETPAAVVDGWMNSPGHRQNILNCAYLDTGVGYYFDAGSEWDHYWTQLFGRQPGAQPAPEPEPEPGLSQTTFLPLVLR